MTTAETKDLGSDESKATLAKTQFDEGKYDECTGTLSSLSEALNAKVTVK